MIRLSIPALPWPSYYAYEIAPCRDEGVFTERVAPAEAEFWSLYLKRRDSDTPTEWLADFDTEAEAIAAGAMLAGIMGRNGRQLQAGI